MPKFKTTAGALKIVHTKDQIRNLGIITPLRVTAEDEELDLDESQQGEEAYS